MSESQVGLAAKPGRRDAATKVARQRLPVLDLATPLGNAAEACRRREMNRTSFFEPRWTGPTSAVSRGACETQPS